MKAKPLDIKFDCTLCGGCCHDLRIALSVREAQSWSERGGDVHILCNAWAPFAPKAADNGADSSQETFRRQRSFAATSGSLPIRVSVTLAGAFDGPCPFLLKDLRCGAYEERPRVCRIYPAEIDPFMPFSTKGKRCPPEAWSTGGTPFLTAGEPPSETAALIRESRQAAIDDMPVKTALCEIFQINIAGLINEGYAIYRPSPQDFREALERSLTPNRTEIGQAQWSIATNRSNTDKVLHAAGIKSIYSKNHRDAPYDYVGFYEPS